MKKMKATGIYECTHKGNVGRRYALLDIACCVYMQSSVTVFIVCIQDIWIFVTHIISMSDYPRIKGSMLCESLCIVMRLSLCCLCGTKCRNMSITSFIAILPLAKLSFNKKRVMVTGLVGLLEMFRYGYRAVKRQQHYKFAKHKRN